MVSFHQYRRRVVFSSDIGNFTWLHQHVILLIRSLGSQTQSVKRKSLAYASVTYTSSLSSLLIKNSSITASQKIGPQTDPCGQSLGNSFIRTKQDRPSKIVTRSGNIHKHCNDIFKFVMSHKVKAPVNRSFCRLALLKPYWFSCSPCLPCRKHSL